MQQISGVSFSLSSQSPSFTTFSSENIADIAARVVKELNLSHSDPYDDEFYSSVTLNDAFQQTTPPSQNDTVKPQKDEVEEEEEEEEEEDEESEFEFAILCGEENSSPISADDIFSNGQIKPMFPIFNTDLVYGYGYRYNQNDAVRQDQDREDHHLPQTMRLPLRKILEVKESRNGGVSCSSSEADDLEGVPPGTYCVWTPTKKEEVMKMRKKSKSTASTGSSKRWRFKDLLYRSNSDGKDTFVFLTPHHKAIANGDGKRKEKMVTVGGGKKKGGLEGGNGNGNGNGNGKKKSYLPYRQDLVGFFANVNGISRTVRPF